MAFTHSKHCPPNHLIPPNLHHPTHLCPCHLTHLCLCHPTVQNKHLSHYKHKYNPPTFLEWRGHVFQKDDPVILLLLMMMQHSCVCLDCHCRSLFLAQCHQQHQCCAYGWSCEWHSAAGIWAWISRLYSSTIRRMQKHHLSTPKIHSITFHADVWWRLNSSSLFSACNQYINN